MLTKLQWLQILSLASYRLKYADGDEFDTLVEIIRIARAESQKLS